MPSENNPPTADEISENDAFSGIVAYAMRQSGDDSPLSQREHILGGCAAFWQEKFLREYRNSKVVKFKAPISGAP